MSEPGPAVQFRKVTKAFGSVTVFRDLSLALPAGMTTAVVGASGSGKTTLLQCINGLVRPDSGTVEVFDAPIPEQDLVPFRRRIGYAVQGAGLFPHMSAADNLALLPRLEGWSAACIDQRRRALFADFELPDTLLQRFPHELSGGQRQRLGLCRALMLEPPLLLLDEPFSAVDPITREGIYQCFERRQAELPVTSVLVTHDMREAVRLAGFLVILADGQVLQAAATAQVLAAPATAYVDTLVRTQL